MTSLTTTAMPGLGPLVLTWQEPVEFWPTRYIYLWLGRRRCNKPVRPVVGNEWLGRPMATENDWLICWERARLRQLIVGVFPESCQDESRHPQSHSTKGLAGSEAGRPCSTSPLFGRVFGCFFPLSVSCCINICLHFSFCFFFQCYTEINRTLSSGKSMKLILNTAHKSDWLSDWLNFNQ